jgi:hypothetical protein
LDCRVALKLPGFCLWTETHRSGIELIPLLKRNAKYRLYPISVGTGRRFPSVFHPIENCSFDRSFPILAYNEANFPGKFNRLNQR